MAQNPWLYIILFVFILPLIYRIFNSVLIVYPTPIISSLTAQNDQKFRFGYDSISDQYGYIVESGGADTFIPFKSVENIYPNTAPTAKYQWTASGTKTFSNKLIVLSYFQSMYGGSTILTIDGIQYPIAANTYGVVVLNDGQEHTFNLYLPDARYNYFFVSVYD